jgi:hypothetical protein
MDITVSVKIEMDASASLSQMERQIQEAGREAMKEGWSEPILPDTGKVNFPALKGR